MIKITVLELLNATGTLQTLAPQQLKGRSAFVLRRLFQKAQPEIASACAARDSLLTEENSRAVEGGRVLLESFTQEFLANPLFSTVVTLDCEPLTPEILTDAVISPAQLDMLGPLLNEE